MRDHLHYDDDAIFNTETHHEKSDVNVRALLIFVACFIAFGALTHAIVYVMFNQFANVERKKSVGTELTAMPAVTGANVPAEPRLQPFPNRMHDGNVPPPNTNTPLTDMADMRAAEEESLNKAGWVDKQKGVVRLPIETAKQLVVQRGLPVVQP